MTATKTWWTEACDRGHFDCSYTNRGPCGNDPKVGPPLDDEGDTMTTTFVPQTLKTKTTWEVIHIAQTTFGPQAIRNTFDNKDEAFHLAEDVLGPDAKVEVVETVTTRTSIMRRGVDF